MKKDFVDYIRVAAAVCFPIHAANNSFSGWKESEEMVGPAVAARPPSAIASLLTTQGKIVREEPGKGAEDGPRRRCTIGSTTTRDTQHPITQRHAGEMDAQVRRAISRPARPAENINILLTAYSDPARGGTGKNEPIVWWVPYGKGQVVVNVHGPCVPRGRPGLP